MDSGLAKKYYSNKTIQKAILEFAKNREIGVMFNGFFGKRPDVLEYESDINILVNKGAFSFHCSEERWENPLLLGENKVGEDEKNKNKLGWDLILDLDGISFEYSRIVARIIIDFFEELGIKNSSIKFSGNKGFHIGVPFEAFSSNIIGIGETRLLFPEAPRRISAYIICELKNKISKEILNLEGDIEKIAKKFNLNKEDLKSNDKETNFFNFLKVIEIDTILISSRHLFRMPYSLNEKSGLVSIPISKEKIMDFQTYWAKPFRIKPEFHKNYSFLKYDEKFGKDADILLIKAYEDDYVDNVVSSIPKDNILTEFNIDFEVSMKDFPKTINYILKNNFSDGRKRALFVLLTFLSSINWDFNSIESLIKEWNDIQEKPLKNNYILAQISWFKSQNKKISPPNYSNNNYYEGIGINKSIINEDINAFNKKPVVKNPLHFVFLKKRKGKNK